MYLYFIIIIIILQTIWNETILGRRVFQVFEVLS